MALLESVAAATILAGANYADYNTTRRAIDGGMVEGNVLYGTQGERLAPIKLVATAGEFAIFNALRKEHKALAWLWVGTLVAANLAIAHHNHNALERWNR